MRNRQVSVLILCAATLTGVAAQDRLPVPTSASTPAAPTPQTAKLPIERVVLYKNGVGYFEHLGRVRDNQEISISFTSGQLNDVLKSLTILDLNGGHISGVNYGSAAPLDRQLADLRLGAGEKTNLTAFLDALRGARLEIRSGTAVISGRLLSVERKTRISGGTTLEVDYLALVTDTGEVKTTELSPAFSVRLLEPGLTGKVSRYLDLVSASREADVRRMVISTAGSGQRSLFVSYISEVPVWKTSYRIVLPTEPGKQPLLQGWAIVDNTVGEDWRNVKLSLVAGAPQSFIQQLSKPYYSRRPVIPLPENADTIPQTFEPTLSSGPVSIQGTISDGSGASVPGATVTAYDANSRVAGSTRADPSGRYHFSGLPAGAIRLIVESQGFQPAEATVMVLNNGTPAQQDVRLQLGSVAEAVNVTAEAASIQTSSAAASRARSTGSGAALGRRSGSGAAYGPGSDSGGSGAIGAAALGINDARDRLRAAAQGQDLGDLFEYKLKEPITILKNQSALVPILQSPITAEKVSVWNERSMLGKPRLALWLTNSTGLTLDGGSFSVLAQNTFAGEGLIEPVRPGEKRLVSYAVDLSVTASARQESDPQRFTRVRVSRGSMLQESEIREKKTYTFRNADSTARVVIVEHPLRPGYQLRSEVSPAESSPGWHRFRVDVPPNQSASLVIDEARAVQTTFSLAQLRETQVELFVRQKSIDKSLEDALRKALAQKAVVEDLQAKKQALEAESSKIYDDQERLRENMKALKGSIEEKTLLQRYTRQLNDQETRLDALKKEVMDLEAQSLAAQELLNQMLDRITADVKL